MENEHKLAASVNIKGGVKKLLEQNRHHINISAFTKSGFLKYNPALKEKIHNLRYARNLPEVLLWNQLKRDAPGVDFHRQKPIANYIVDFFCPELMLVIEIDGIEHSNTKTGEYDCMREKELVSFGINILRFPIKDVLENMQSVLANIELYIHENKIEEKLSQLERAVYNRNKDLLFDTLL